MAKADTMNRVHVCGWWVIMVMPEPGPPPAPARAPSSPLRARARRRCREEVHHPRDDAGPAGLMAGAEPGAVVAVEVLVEQDEIAPVRIVLELAACRRRPAAGRRSSSQEDARPAGAQSSSATSYSFMRRPEPVGHSIVKLSP